MSFDTIKNKLSALEKKFIQELLAEGINLEDPIRLTMFSHNFVSRWPEYIDALNEIEKEPSIKRYDDKLLTVGGSGRSVSCRRFLDAFLHWSVTPYEGLSFEERFSSFSDYFSKNTIVSIQSCYLYNFQTDLGVVDLPFDLRLRPLTTIELGKTNEKNKFPRQFLSHMLERVTDLEVTVSSTNMADRAAKNESDHAFAFEHIAAAQEAFGKFLYCLHTLKECASHVDGTVFDRYEGFAEFVHGGTSRSPINPHPKQYGSVFTLGESELPDIERYFQIITDQKHKKFALASRRLFFADSRDSLEDRILDYCIALEALFLPKSTTELSFRLGMRLGKTLGCDGNEAHDIYSFAKKFYGLRSKVAHGEELPPSIHEDVTKASELLRKALAAYLVNPGNFSDDYFNRSMLNATQNSNLDS